MAKDVKKQKQEKVSFWAKLGKFFSRVGFKIAGFFVKTWHELRRMRWPSKKTLIGATCVVLSFILLFGAYIIFDDFIISVVFRYVIHY